MDNAQIIPAYLRSQQGNVMLAVKLQPRASANEIGEALGDELRIKVTAPPVDAAANEALLKLLSKTLDVGRSKVELVRGQTSRHKVLRISGLPIEQVAAKLVAA